MRRAGTWIGGGAMMWRHGGGRSGWARWRGGSARRRAGAGWLALGAVLALYPATARAQEVAAPGAAVEEAATVTVPAGTLHGTLLVPATVEGPVPVALIIAGSGPTDRDGNNPLIPGRNDSLKLLAEALAAKGIASLRYDKRGIGASREAGLDEAAVVFDDFVDDAVAWVRQLEADRRFSRVVIVGHSEGSLIGAIAARRGGVAGFVSVAGMGRPAQEVLREQLRAQLPPAIMADAEAILDELEAGRTVDSVPPSLNTVFRTSVQPFVISLFRYDPAAEVARLEVPVLIVQGTTDIQVGVEEARVLADARPDARFVLIEGMNHVLKEAPADRMANVATYGDPSLPVVPRLIEEVASFILGS